MVFTISYKNFMNMAFKPADLLLPRGAEMEKWAVIACDQHTGEPEYWQKAKETVGAADSALKLILPEVYLEEPDVGSRIESIHREMNRLLAENRFDKYPDTLFYIERTQSDGAVREGIVGRIDLEEYDYHAGSASQVRATEAAVPERLPPRIQVRRGAALELPHTMILIDDEQKTVIEPCARAVAEAKPVYDFSLMANGGKIRGFALPPEEAERIRAALERLGGREAFQSRYGLENAPILLYAVGDGNHSLAAAKEFYEQLKRENPGKDFSSHPARYALAEIVNLHSPALQFEAIHRIVKRTDPQALLAAMTKTLDLRDEPSEQQFTAVFGETERKLFIHKPLSELTVGSVQVFLDDYLKSNSGKTDYIHGADVVRRLSRRENCIGFLLPDMKKSELFPTVIKDGTLPRKTFSMGRAEDKRYYIECRKIQ